MSRLGLATWHRHSASFSRACQEIPLDLNRVAVFADFAQDCNQFQAESALRCLAGDVATPIPYPKGVPDNGWPVFWHDDPRDRVLSLIEQRLLPVWAAYWKAIAIENYPVDRAKLEGALRRLYLRIGKSAPPVRWVGGVEGVLTSGLTNCPSFFSLESNYKNFHPFILRDYFSSDDPKVNALGYFMRSFDLPVRGRYDYCWLGKLHFCHAIGWADVSSLQALWDAVRSCGFWLAKEDEVVAIADWPGESLALQARR